MGVILDTSSRRAPIRSSFAGRCFAAHLWQVVRSLNERVCITKTRPDRNHAVEVACLAVRLLHINNRCTVQQLLQCVAQERRPRDGLCSVYPCAADGLTGQPGALQALPFARAKTT